MGGMGDTQMSLGVKKLCINVGAGASEKHNSEMYMKPVII